MNNEFKLKYSIQYVLLFVITVCHFFYTSVFINLFNPFVHYYPFIHPSINSSINSSIHPSIHPLIHLSVHLSVHRTNVSIVSASTADFDGDGRLDAFVLSEAKFGYYGYVFWGGANGPTGVCMCLCMYVCVYACIFVCMFMV